MKTRKVQIDDAFWFQEGPGVRKWQFTNTGIKLLNVGNILPTGELDLSKTDRCLSREEAEKRYKHFFVDEGDLVIASSGISFDDDGLLRTRGAFVRCSHLPLCLNTSTIRFKAKDDADLRYFRFWLDSHEFRSQITRLVTGSAQQNFGPSHLENIQITLPDLSEQRQIAAQLDQADRLRRTRRYALQLTDTFLPAAFLELFGDPEKGPGERIELQDIAEILTGYPFLSDKYVKTGEKVRLCRGTNVLPNRIDWSDLAEWPRSEVRHLSDFVMTSGDIVIAMDRPWIGEGFKVAQIRDEDCPSLLVQRVARLRGKQGIPNAYLYYLLRHQSFTRHCRPTETTIPHISPTDIRTFLLCLNPWLRTRS